MIGAILWGIIGGAVIGVLARLIMPGKQNISVWVTIAVGIIAALLGGIIATWIGVGDTKGIDWIRHAIQIGLAIIFVVLAERYMPNRRSVSQ